MSRKIPKGWMNYSNMGSQLTGTKFVPLKTPLKLGLCQNRIPEDCWFTPRHVLEQLPHLKLIINLTHAVNGRYYDYEDFKDAGVRVLHIVNEGHGVLPPARRIREFFLAVDNFIRSEAQSNGLIGVHCTHGLNRTGYFICKYLVDRMNMDPNSAIELFENARGHRIERPQYVADLHGSTSTWTFSEGTYSNESIVSHTTETQTTATITNWRDRDNDPDPNLSHRSNRRNRIRVRSPPYAGSSQDIEPSFFARSRPRSVRRQRYNPYYK